MADMDNTKERENERKSVSGDGVQDKRQERKSDNEGNEAKEAR